MPKSILAWTWIIAGAVSLPLFAPSLLPSCVLLLVYATINIMWSLVLGTGGMFSFATVAIAGMAAYLTAFLSVHHGWSWYATLPVAAVAGAVMGAVVAMPALRLRGVYFALFTFGLVELVRSIVLQDRENLGGGLGLFGASSFIPEEYRFTTAGYTIGYAAGLLLLSLAVGVYQGVARGPLGALLRTSRECEPVAKALGINVARARLAVFVVTSMVLGIAGWFYTSYFQAVSPTIFDFSLSLMLLAMIVVGGSRSLGGILCGTALLFILDQELRETNALRFVVIGSVMLAVTLIAEQGLAGLVSNRRKQPSNPRFKEVTQ